MNCAERIWPWAVVAFLFGLAVGVALTYIIVGRVVNKGI